MKDSIGMRLKELRLQKDYTQEYVGGLIGVSKQTLYKYENGVVTNIPSDKIEALAKVYGVTPEYIMGWSEPTSGEDTPHNSPSSNTIGTATKKLTKGVAISGASGVAAGAATSAIASAAAGSVPVVPAALGATAIGVTAAAVIPAALFGILSIMSQDELDKVESFAKFIVKDKKIPVPNANQTIEKDNAKTDDDIVKDENTNK